MNKIRNPILLFKSLCCVFLSSSSFSYGSDTCSSVFETLLKQVAYFEQKATDYHRKSNDPSISWSMKKHWQTEQDHALNMATRYKQTIERLKNK